jgi:PAS domain S-box-containing protein
LGDVIFMRLSKFISSRKEPILQGWEDFARSLMPSGARMDVAELRDHASLMLDVVVADLKTPQSSEEQALKAHGKSPRPDGESYAELHASDRLASGFTIGQLVAEYRALRASVLKLWADETRDAAQTDLEDVTRFNEAIDQALSESVARFASTAAETAENERGRVTAILETVPVGISLVNKNGEVLLANAEDRRIWGEHAQAGSIAPEAWSGWWADGSERHGLPLRPEEWAIARALVGDEANGDTVDIEPYGSSGVRRTVLQRSKATRDGSGTVTGAVLAQIDITEQVKTQAALRESEAKFRTIANAMPQMVWSTRPDGFDDYYNDQWYRFTGAEPQSTNGDGWNALFHPDDQQRAWTTWQRSLSTGEAYEIQYRLRHHSGEYRWTLGRALPVRTEDGTIIRWMGTCTDIHDQKVAEEGLKKQSERKDEFLAMLAHELRNPLAPISTGCTPAEAYRRECAARHAIERRHLAPGRPHDKPRRRPAGRLPSNAGAGPTQDGASGPEARAEPRRRAGPTADRIGAAYSAHTRSLGRRVHQRRQHSSRPGHCEPAEQRCEIHVPGRRDLGRP